MDQRLDACMRPRPGATDQGMRRRHVRTECLVALKPQFRTLRDVVRSRSCQRKGQALIGAVEGDNYWSPSERGTPERGRGTRGTSLDD